LYECILEDKKDESETTNIRKIVAKGCTTNVRPLLASNHQILFRITRDSCEIRLDNFSIDTYRVYELLVRLNNI